MILLLGMSDQIKYRPAAKYAGPSSQRPPVQSRSTLAWFIKQFSKLESKDSKPVLYGKGSQTCFHSGNRPTYLKLLIRIISK
jgi:hypothetical protein